MLRSIFGLIKNFVPRLNFPIFYLAQFKFLTQKRRQNFLQFLKLAMLRRQIGKTSVWFVYIYFERLKQLVFIFQAICFVLQLSAAVCFS